MSDPISHLYTLHTNPFLFATTLHGFYDQLGARQHSVLLAYLVLPIVLEQKNRDFLQKARSTSSLRTMLTHRELLTAIPQRLEDYRQVTVDTLRYLVSAHLLEVQGSEVVLGPNSPPDPIAPPGAVAAARKLAEFFKPFDVPTIYRLLGVIQL
jgi:hypothetical protein